MDTKSITPQKILPFCDRAGHPARLFKEWLDEAQQAGIQHLSLVVLATASECGAPSCRVVTLRECDEKGFVLCLNAPCCKSHDCDVEQNPQAALCFHWPEIGKQVRIEGYIGKAHDVGIDSCFRIVPDYFEFQCNAGTPIPQSAVYCLREGVWQKTVTPHP